MKGLNRLGLIKIATGFVGAATLTSLASLPAFAQLNPRPSIFNEPAYDGNPGTGAGQVVPSAPGQSQVNPSNVNQTPANRVPSNRIPGANTPNAPINQAATSAEITPLDREFMLMAAQGNNAEIRTSQLALQRSESEEVRDYAQRMIQEHTQANRQLQQIASERGMRLPNDPGPLNAAVEAELAQLSGEEFDRAYIGAQTNAHLRTVALYRTQIEQGQDESLRSYATQLLPSITEHYEMASQMSPQYRADDVLQPLQ
jgi:putative membrane protein